MENNINDSFLVTCIINSIQIVILYLINMELLNIYLKVMNLKKFLFVWLKNLNITCYFKEVKKLEQNFLVILNKIIIGIKKFFLERCFF
ncbi:hypothetical protein CUM80_08835 [Enterococcus faecalis]|nr:hypothetical protein CUM80_08835 [Enterococcus faecalis]